MQKIVGQISSQRRAIPKKDKVKRKAGAIVAHPA
jgi:hypothetical protein